MQENKIIASSRWKTVSKTLLILLDIDFSCLMYQNLINTVTAGCKDSSCPEKNQTGRRIAQERGKITCKLPSMALGIGSLANKKTQAESTWNVVEQAKVAQKVKARAHIALRCLPLVRGGRDDMSPPRGDKESKNNIWFSEKNEKGQLSDSLVINRVLVW